MEGAKRQTVLTSLIQVLKLKIVLLFGTGSRDALISQRLPRFSRPARLHQRSQQEGERRSHCQTQHEEEGHERAGRLAVFMSHQPEDRNRKLQREPQKTRQLLTETSETTKCWTSETLRDGLEIQSVYKSLNKLNADGFDEDSLWSVGHAEARQVPVGEGEQGHDGDEGTVVSEEVRESGALHVTQHEQRDEEQTGQHGGRKQQALLRRLHKHQQHQSIIRIIKTLLISLLKMI